MFRPDRCRQFAAFGVHVHNARSRLVSARNLAFCLNTLVAKPVWAEDVDREATNLFLAICVFGRTPANMKGRTRRRGPSFLRNGCLSAGNREAPSPTASPAVAVVLVISEFAWNAGPAAFWKEIPSAVIRTAGGTYLIRRVSGLPSLRADRSVCGYGARGEESRQQDGDEVAHVLSPCCAEPEIGRLHEYIVLPSQCQA